MKKITISVEFKVAGRGHINVIPTDFQQWEPTGSSFNTYVLDPGDYTITYDTLTSAGGAITVTDDGGNIIAVSDLKSGVDGGSFDITI